MPLTRRDFLASSASLAGLVATSRLGFGQSGPTGVPAEFKPKSAATADFLKSIGPVQAAELLKRLQKTNSDIKLKGLKTIRGVPNAGGIFSRATPTRSFTTGTSTLKISISVTTASPCIATPTSSSSSAASRPTATSTVP